MIIAVVVIGLVLLGGLIWVLIIFRRCMNIMKDLERDK